MICRNCGKENADGVKYCFYCGEDMTAPPPPEPEPEPQSVVPEKQVMPVAKPKKNIKLIAAIITVSALAFIGGIVAIVLSMNSHVAPVKPSIAATGAADVSQQSEASTTEAPKTDAPKKTYANINTVKTALGDSDLEQLQSTLKAKSSATSVNVKLMLDNSLSSGDVQKKAESACKTECGDNGILLTVNDTTYALGISASGKGGDFLPENLRQKILKDVAIRSGGSAVSMVSDVLSAIPNNKKDADLYRFKRRDGSEQIVYANSSSGTLTLLEWDGYTPKKLFQTNTVYFGKDGLTDSPREGLSATPKGEFRLGFAFSTQSLSTKLDTMTITDGTVWVDDPDSDYYNTVQHGSTSNPPLWSSAENTYSIFSSGRNYACILIEHNGDGFTKGASSKGSCMYLSGKNQDVGTSYGDVNITASDMRKLLSYLDRNKNPYIFIS